MTMISGSTPPINTEPIDEQHAAQLAEAQDQIDRLSSENDELQAEITGLRRERDTAVNERDELRRSVDGFIDAVRIAADASRGG